MLQAIDVSPPTTSLPTFVAWGVAYVCEFVCKLFNCEPLLDTQQLVVAGQEVSGFFDSVNMHELICTCNKYIIFSITYNSTFLMYGLYTYCVLSSGIC